MYYDSNNATCSKNPFSIRFIYDPAETHTKTISDTFADDFKTKNIINSIVSGYTEKEERKLEKAYSMADKNNNMITKNYIIDNILGLKDNSMCGFIPYLTYYLIKILTNVVHEADVFRTKNGINSIVNGYTEKEEKKVVKAYPMADTNINLITRDYVIANAALDDISGLENNWNDHGAKCFSRQLVEKCRTIVNDLVAEPFVCPTACGSIQFEYEKEDGDYLEFEVFEDRIEVYSDTKENGEREFNLEGITATDKMKQLVVDFYG